MGSVIKQCYDEQEESSDEEDEVSPIFGITTAVNLTNDQNNQSVKQIKELLFNKAESSGKDDMVKLLHDSLQGDQHAGLLINERYVNIPAQISSPLFESLYSEIMKASENSAQFNFTSFILISKFYKKEDKQGKAIEEIYSNPEEESFLQHALGFFDYTVKNEADTGFDGSWEEDDSQLIPFRRVMFFNSNVVSDLIAELKSMFT